MMFHFDATLSLRHKTCAMMFFLIELNWRFSEMALTDQFATLLLCTTLLLFYTTPLLLILLLYYGNVACCGVAGNVGYCGVAGNVAYDDVFYILSNCLMPMMRVFIYWALALCQWWEFLYSEQLP
jgi:hypothetical protein